MATTASIAANSPSSIHSYSMSRSSPWKPTESEAIHHDDPMTLIVSQDDRLFSPGKDTSDNNDNADKKPVWNKTSSISAEVGPVMGAESWPALSLSAKASSNKSPSMESGGSPTFPTPTPQIGVTRLTSNSNSNAVAENHTVNGQRRPYRRNNMTSSSSSSTRDQNHNQRSGGSYGSGTTTNQFRNSNRNRNNTSSYPRGDHGNQSGLTPHRNYNVKDMHLQQQPQRGGIGMMRPHMLMGPPSFPASSAQYMAGSYGGPMIYQDYAPQIFMPHPPPPDSMPLVGHFPPVPMYYPSFDAMLYNKILTQVEFYFSADNLSRDEFLRRQMNGEGWVPVRVIAGFKKLAELTNNIQTIVEALRTSQVVEIKGETIRRRGDWFKYLWPIDSSKFSPAAAMASSNASLQSQLESMTLSER